MPGIDFALSVNHFITSVGADAGFAAVIGLAVLVLLYFTHARETAALRERAAVLESRVLQLESRLSTMARSPAPASNPNAPAPQPAFLAPRPASGAPFTDPPGLGGEVRVADQRGSVRVAPELPPSAPVGSAGPALASATRHLPTIATPSPGGSADAPPSPSPAPARPPARSPSAPAPSPPVSEPGWPAPPLVPAPAAQAYSSSEEEVPARPATVAGGANGRQEGSPPLDRPAQRPPVRTPPPPQRASALDAPASSRTAREDFSGGRRDAVPPSRGGRLLGVVILGVAVVVVIAVLVAVTSSGGSSQPQAGSSPTTNAPASRHTPAAARFNPASVTVAVLNGTATSGLAHRISLKLGVAGYRAGAVVTAPDQTHTATIVGYTPGHQADALQVAKALKLGSASVQPVDTGTEAVACPPPAACSTQVVVTVGADLATTA